MVLGKRGMSEEQLIILILFLVALIILVWAVKEKIGVIFGL